MPVVESTIESPVGVQKAKMSEPTSCNLVRDLHGNTWLPMAGSDVPFVVAHVNLLAICALLTSLGLCAQLMNPLPDEQGGRDSAAATRIAGVQCPGGEAVLGIPAQAMESMVSASKRRAP